MCRISRQLTSKTSYDNSDKDGFDDAFRKDDLEATKKRVFSAAKVAEMRSDNEMWKDLNV